MSPFSAILAHCQPCHEAVAAVHGNRASLLRSLWFAVIAVIASASILLALAYSGCRSTRRTPEQKPRAPAHISLVEGVAALERDGSTEDAPANMLLLAGDRIRTRVGRVEILFADGSTLHLDHNSAIDLQSDELVRLLDGRLRLSIPARARDVSYRIDGPHAWAQISQPGEYRAAVIQNAGLSGAGVRGASRQPR